MRFDSAPQRLGSHGKIIWHGVNLTTALNPVLKSVLKLSSVVKTALGTVVSPQYTVDEGTRNKIRKQQRKTKSKSFGPEAVCTFPRHRCDSAPCFYQPVCVCTCIVFMASHLSHPYLHSCLNILETFIWKHLRKLAAFIIYSTFAPKTTAIEFAKVLTMTYQFHRFLIRVLLMKAS